MSLKPTDNSFKLTFFKKIVAYELKKSGHVLIFYPTQVKLSGRTKCPKRLQPVQES